MLQMKRFVVFQLSLIALDAPDPGMRFTLFLQLGPWLEHS